MSRRTVAGGLLLAVAFVPASRGETLRVSAAASLAESFQEIARIFEQAHPGDRVELNFAGSQVLRTQIEQGASVDVFASADLVHADALRQAGLLGSYEVFARNRLVAVAPATRARVRGLQDLARPGVKIVVAGPSVPVGRYTTQVVSKLGAAGLFAHDFAARLQANVVSQETNVRAVLSKVALGEADAGFVYATDAAAAANVAVIDVPAGCNVAAEYPIGVLGRSALPEQARAFVALVLSEQGQTVLRTFGFQR
jgi:molybdate transport system substrate-binding protein